MVGWGSHTSDYLDLGNSMGITENNTDLRGGGTLLRELADLLDDLFGSGLEPVEIISVSFGEFRGPWKQTSWGESWSTGWRTQRYPFHWSEDDPFLRLLVCLAETCRENLSVFWMLLNSLEVCKICCVGSWLLWGLGVDA